MSKSNVPNKTTALALNTKISEGVDKPGTPVPPGVEFPREMLVVDVRLDEPQ